MKMPLKIFVYSIVKLTFRLFLANLFRFLQATAGDEIGNHTQTALPNLPSLNLTLYFSLSIEAVNRARHNHIRTTINIRD